MENILLLENVNHLDFAEYYCANIVEERYGKCENLLIYRKGGGFGLNYRYCSSCYSKWNGKEIGGKKKYLGIGTCLIKLDE